jgi:hypothetical protein
MPKLPILALAAALALPGCNGTDESTEAPADELDAGTTAADMSATTAGKGDMSSAAGAGADTNAMDGGKAGDDGEPAAADQGEGGPSDALSGGDDATDEVD